MKTDITPCACYNIIFHSKLQHIIPGLQAKIVLRMKKD